MPSRLPQRQFSAGDPLSAKKDIQVLWDEVRRLGNLTVSAGLQLLNSPGGMHLAVLNRAEFMVMRIESVGTDTLTCIPIEDTTADPIAVAKPYNLRVTPFADEIVNEISYTGVTSTNRTATRLTITEQQVVTPPYVPRSDASGYLGDEILCMKINESEIDYDTTQNEVPAWIDMNIDARAWAKIAGAS